MTDAMKSTEKTFMTKGKPISQTKSYLPRKPRQGIADHGSPMIKITPSKPPCPEPNPPCPKKSTEATIASRATITSTTFVLYANAVIPMLFQERFGLAIKQELSLNGRRFRIAALFTFPTHASRTQRSISNSRSVKVHQERNRKAL